MDPPPAEISLPRHRDLAGRRHQAWGRRAFLALLLALCIAALVGVFGEGSTRSSAAGPAATLAVDAPDRLRGGLFAELELTIGARRAIAKPRIVLNRGWLDQMTINTIVPEAAAQADDQGRLVLAYDRLPAGRTLTVRVQFQVNPVKIGVEDQGVELRDGARTVARVHRTLTVFP
jgi:hypothetical protein